MIDPATGAFLLYAAACLLLVAAGLGAWLIERGQARTRQASRHARPSRVWVFNNMPAGAVVDTQVSCAPVSRTARQGAR